MSKDTVMKILLAVGVAGSALVSAGIIPGGAVIGALFSAIAGSAGILHSAPGGAK